jgi:hypothetical protein
MQAESSAEAVVKEEFSENTSKKTMKSRKWYGIIFIKKKKEQKNKDETGNRGVLVALRILRITVNARQQTELFRLLIWSV